MSDTHPPTLIHLFADRQLLVSACGLDLLDEKISGGGATVHTGQVTCFACRKSEAFKQAQLRQGVGLPTPPVKLSGVMADAEEIAELGREARRRELEALAAKEMVAAARNERGMYVIEEVIHHGDYRSTRRVEVYAINPVTVDAVIQSSAYGYGSWLDPNGPYPEARRPKLFSLVEDLKHGRTNRDVGWSTFRLITKH